MKTLCAPCVKGDHRACIGVPPVGDWCGCVLRRATPHCPRGEVRLVIGMEPTENGPSADPDYEGGLASRRVISRWEWEEQRYLETTRG